MQHDKGAFRGCWHCARRLRIRNKVAGCTSSAQCVIAGPGCCCCCRCFAPGLPMCKTVVEDTWNKIFIGGLPCHYTDEQVSKRGGGWGVRRPVGSEGAGGRPLGATLDTRAAAAAGYQYSVPHVPYHHPSLAARLVGLTRLRPWHEALHPQSLMMCCAVLPCCCALR